MVEFYSKASLPTLYGNFEIYVFKDRLIRQGQGPAGEARLEHIVLFKEYEHLPVLVRIHSKCLTGDVLGSLRCDCGFQLGQALSAISQVGGLLIYLDQEGRGIGLADKIRAYALQDKGHDTVDANLLLGFDADERDFTPASFILDYFKIKTLALLTNNPKKMAALEGRGFDVTRIPMPCGVNLHNKRYLEAKKQRMGHDLVIGDCDMVERYRRIVKRFARRSAGEKRNGPSRPKQQIR